MTSLINFNDFGLRPADLAVIATNLLTEISKDFDGCLSDGCLPVDEIIENIALLDYVIKRNNGAVDTYRALNCFNALLQHDNDDLREASLRAMTTLIDLKKPFLDKDFVKPLICFLDTTDNSVDIVHITCLLLQAVYRNKRPIDKNDRTLRAIVDHEKNGINSGIGTYIASLIKTAIIYNPHLAEHLTPSDRHYYQNSLQDEGKDLKLRKLQRHFKS